MVRPLDESKWSSPLQGHGSWLMCEVALSWVAVTLLCLPNGQFIVTTVVLNPTLRDVGLEWLLCPSMPRLLGYMKRATSTRRLANQNRGRSNFPTNTLERV